MPNEIPKGAIRGCKEITPNDKVYCVYLWTRLESLRARAIPEPQHIHPSWFASQSGFLFKNYWDARAYVLKREHDRSTRNKEVLE